jgi:hypothetical protein
MRLRGKPLHSSSRLVIILIFFVAILSAGSSASWAKKCKPPTWVLVATAPGVEYAPNLGMDVFRCQNRIYYYHQEKWHTGPGPLGPWRVVQTVPPELYLVEARYFKTPPGWAKGKKKGWRGHPLPPGQMKKLYL